MFISRKELTRPLTKGDAIGCAVTIPMMILIGMCTRHFESPEESSDARRIQISPAVPYPSQRWLAVLVSSGAEPGTPPDPGEDAVTLVSQRALSILDSNCITWKDFLAGDIPDAAPGETVYATLFLIVDPDGSCLPAEWPSIEGAIGRGSHPALVCLTTAQGAITLNSTAFSRASPPGVLIPLQSVHGFEGANEAAMGGVQAREIPGGYLFIVNCEHPSIIGPEESVAHLSTLLREAADAVDWPSPVPGRNTMPDLHIPSGADLSDVNAKIKALTKLIP